MISSSLDTASPKKNIVCFRPKLLKQKLFYRFQKKKKKKIPGKERDELPTVMEVTLKNVTRRRGPSKNVQFFFFNLTYRLVEVIKNKIKNKFPTYPLVKMTTNRKQTYIFFGLTQQYLSFIFENWTDNFKPGIE